MDIRLDKQTFKAVASGTRVDILKLLGKRRHMQSELANNLDLSVPTVKEHLAALSKAGLVERHDEGRKWKYYSLTRKGKGVLNPEEIKIWIVLGLLVFSMVGGFLSKIGSFVSPVTQSKMAMSEPAMRAVPESMADAAPAAVPDAAPVAEYITEAPITEAYSIWPTAFLFVTIVLIITLIYLIVRAKRYKKQLGESLTKK